MDFLFPNPVCASLYKVVESVETMTRKAEEREKKREVDHLLLRQLSTAQQPLPSSYANESAGGSNSLGETDILSEQVNRIFYF